MTVPTEPTGATPPVTDPPKTAEPATGDGLGEAGKKALAEERAARKALEAEVKALKDRDPVRAIAEALGVKPGETGPDPVGALTQQVQQLQQSQREAELRAARLEVGAAKGFTVDQAAELKGSTREELEAHADRLRALFPSTATPGVPAPDPTQGARGGSNALESQLKAAQEKGDVKEAIRLKTMIAAQKNR